MGDRYPYISPSNPHSMVRVVPSMVGMVPSMVRVVPSMVGVVPSMVGVIPSLVGKHLHPSPILAACVSMRWHASACGAPQVVGP